MSLDPHLVSHKPGFKTVTWYGKEYRFSSPQAACVAILWRNWLGGTPIVRESIVLETAGIEARSLKDVFRMPPGRDAWGTLIGTGDRRGTVRLIEPEQPTAGARVTPIEGSESCQSPATQV